MVDLSIIIPAYNEEKVLESTVLDYINFFKKTKLNFEIIIIPNNCTDSTPRIASSLEKKHKQIKQKNFPYFIGKGGAVIEGIKLAQGNLISYVDADNATKPDALLKLINNIQDYHCVMGSRWMKNSIILKKQTLKRRIASRGFNLLVRLILGLNYTDTQCGAKLFKKEAIKTVLSNLIIVGWAFDVGVLYQLKKHNFKIKEIPITWEDNPEYKLDMKKAIPNMLKSLIKIRLGK